MKIGFRKLAGQAKLPTRNHKTDAGIDFYSCNDIPIIIKPHTTKPIPTGIAWQPTDIPEEANAVIVIKSRSGLAFKHGIECSNAGVIDQDYRGEIKLLLHNNSDNIFIVNNGDKLAQGIVYLIPQTCIEEIHEVEETERGTKGFGSSGI